MLTPDGGMVAVLNARAGLVHTLRVGSSSDHADNAAVRDVSPGFTSGGLSRMAFIQASLLQTPLDVCRPCGHQ
jgi:hypothetical protein